MGAATGCNRASIARQIWSATWALGASASMMTPASRTLAAAPLFQMDKFMPNEVADIMSTMHVTLFVAAVSLWRVLLRNVPQRPLSALVASACSGAQMCALGVLFTLNLGWSIIDMEKETCFYRGFKNPVLISENVTRLWEQKQAREFHEARKTQAYLKQQAEQTAA